MRTFLPPHQLSACTICVYTACTHQLNILTFPLTMHINCTVSTPYSNSTSYPWEAFPPSHHLKIIYMVKVVDNEKTFIGKLGSKVPTALRYKPIAEASEAPVHWSPKNCLILNHHSSNDLSKSNFGRRSFHGTPIFANFILEFPKKGKVWHMWSMYVWSDGQKLIEHE